jgi:hypothetical protein
MLRIASACRAATRATTSRAAILGEHRLLLQPSSLCANSTCFVARPAVVRNYSEELSAADFDAKWKVRLAFSLIYIIP